MSIFDDIDKAEVFGAGAYFEPGEYLVKINAIKYNKGFKGEFYIIECILEESDNEKMIVGRTYNQVINLSRKETGPGNVKAFLAAALDVDPKDESVKWGELAEKACSEENPFAGLQMRLKTFERQTKAGGVFTVHQWTKAI